MWIRNPAHAAWMERRDAEFSPLAQAADEAYSAYIRVLDKYASDGRGQLLTDIAEAKRLMEDTERAWSEGYDAWHAANPEPQMFVDDGRVSDGRHDDLNRELAAESRQEAYDMERDDDYHH